MADIKRLESGPRMSQAVVHNGTVYLAGQVSNQPTGDVNGQTAAILKQIDALLEKCGTDKSKLLNVNVYLSDIATFDQMNAAYEAWAAKDSLPARTTVGVQLARPEYLVEIAVVAAV